LEKAHLEGDSSDFHRFIAGQMRAMALRLIQIASGQP
jgi:hypothetical protein